MLSQVTALTSGYLNEHTDELLRVGARTLTLADAAGHVQAYVSGNTRGAKPFAYPAYDGYPGSEGLDVGPQDLLAPSLLNVPLRSLRTYYGLLDLVPRLNERLNGIPPQLALADAQGDALAHAADVFAVLDGPDAPVGASMTTLAKIVHRKRPAFLPLWDDHIAACYLRAGADGGPRIQPDKRRSWRDFVALWLPELQADLREHREAWDALAGLTPQGGPSITPLRALDIVGWHLGSPGRA